MKSLALGIATVAVVLAVLALFGSYAKADTFVEGMDKSQQAWTFGILCTGDNPDLLGAECQARMMKECPQGGKAEILKHSEPGTTPLWVLLKATCEPVL